MIAWMLLLLQVGGTAWGVPQRTGTDAEFRGLATAGPSVAWAVGRRGVYTRTADTGRSWHTDSIPGADSLFLVDVHAVDGSTAVVLGTDFNGGLSRIYRTADGGAHWRLSYEGRGPGVFFDGMAFWGGARGVAFSDPVGGHLLIIRTSDGGRTWSEVPGDRIPPVLPGEAGFAASGEAIVTAAAGHAWIGTGGGAEARVYRTSDWGATWQASATPLAGSASAGIFGLAFRDSVRGIAVGGDYRAPKATALNVLRTSDGGRSWTLGAASAPAGVRYGAARVPGTSVVYAVGPSGVGWSRDAGAHWVAVDSAGYNTIAIADSAVGWAAGTGGRLIRFRPVRP